MAQPSESKKFFGKKKESDVRAIGITPWRGYRPNHPQFHYYPQMNNTTFGPRPYTSVPRANFQSNGSTTPPFSPIENPYRSNGRRDVGNRPRVIEPIPMSYSELLPKLIENHQIAPIPTEPLKPPYPKWYDANARCDYHGGAAGHSTENCTALKYKVQALRDAKWLNFSESPVKPNVNANPLPDHGNRVINALEEETPFPFGIMKFVWKLNNAEEMSIKREQSEFWEENDVNTIDEGNSVPKSLVIQCPASSRVSVKPRKITIEVPKKFPYHNNKEVPWNYSCQVKVSHEIQSCMDNVKDVSLGNITGVSGMTRSGRCYTPEYLEKLRQEKGKEKVIEEEDDLNEAPPRDAMPRNEGAKRSVTEEEATEFLKIIRQSEYSVVEQLKKLPARISLLSLLLSSEAHREALLKVLNEAHVAHNISLENFDHIVGNIMATDCLTFTDEEIPPEGRGHNKALHISAKCKDYIVARILVDNGSAINVMPKSTLEMLPVDFSNMQHSHMVVRAFDGTRREVLGDIEIPLQIGPCTFQIQFQIMDIKPSYSCLLGRPWIHLAGAVPSTLHQKVKFVVNNQLICVSAEEDFLVTKPITTRYVEAAEEALDCSLQSFEMANAIYVKGGRNNSIADFSNSSKMIARVMLENGYQA